ncbi:PREDICTED: membrane-anchored ubiquitin-fold protein 3-like isoform X1 [Nelumbo nucifera]|uniref:Membrane-anchored ubiquitin-fold protein 3-like isoform X1 n=1 Tax=Nelumbo nucifera TaxID=4432 RepID=A0A1U8AGR7_NELNU|nr:PREDICTED: membrane-anchored ubiquitin-fold protein 3-like isoform X1 [Nelumbo nucifera]XP_010261179.1 PREDICTED: membrane-anchored ubiquitin-fold protein 3-like isoform X1 [Nelumbo nucifera]
MAADELIELKFRLFDGTDIGPNKYNPSTTVGSLKEIILAQWPQDKENGPKTINDVKLINAGKILENSRTLAESRVPVGELPGGVITMHVVVRPPLSDKKNAKTLHSTPFIWAAQCTRLLQCRTWRGTDVRSLTPAHIARLFPRFENY